MPPTMALKITARTRASDACCAATSSMPMVLLSLRSRHSAFDQLFDFLVDVFLDRDGKIVKAAAATHQATEPCHEKTS